MTHEKNDLHLKAAAAIALASSLIIGFPPGDIENLFVVPLLKEASYFYDFYGLALLKALLFGSYLYFGLCSGVLLLAAVTTLVAWLALYSGSGAFVPQIVLNCLLMAFLLRPQSKPADIRHTAAIFTAFIFIFAGLQKINSLYLSGVEFQSTYGFMIFYIHFFGPLPTVLAKDVLPVLSIVIELAIGIGFLFRPKFFSQVAIIFILSLMYVHPTLVLPYLTFLATGFLIDPESAQNMQKRFWKIPLQSIFTWLGVLFFFQTLRTIKNRSAFEYLWFPMTFATVFLVIHLRYFLVKIRQKEWLQDSSIAFSSVVTWGTGLLLFILPVTQKLGAPAPLGFSMFSAQSMTLNPNRADSMPSLVIKNSFLCQELHQKIVLLIVTDVAFSSNNGDCKVVAPTVSGLQYLHESLCKRNSQHCTSENIILNH